MKVRLLYGSVACILSFFIILIFLDFWQQWKAASAFQTRVHNAPLRVRHLLISPEQVNVKNWQVGDTSVYHLQTNTESKQLTFQVAAQETRRRDRFWLKTTGLFQFKGVDIELWRLLDNKNLRPGSELRGFYFSIDGLPFPAPRHRFPPSPVVLEKRGDSVVVTPIGSIKCEHVFAYVRSPDGALEPLLELWVNSAVRPLGIVRARWQDASLELVQADTNAVPEIPQVLLSEFDRNTHMERACTRCHAAGIGGKDIKLEAINWLRGEALNLTTALFHHRQAELLKEANLIHLYFTEKSRQARKRAFARFSWKNGSFWVKPDKTGQVILSLDAIANKSNIAVQPSIGQLALEIKMRQTQR